MRARLPGRHAPMLTRGCASGRLCRRRFAWTPTASMDVYPRLRKPRASMDAGARLRKLGRLCRRRRRIVCPRLPGFAAAAGGLSVLAYPALPPAADCLSSLTRTWLAAAALCMAVLPQLPRRRKPNQSPCIKSYSNSCGLVHGRVAAAAAAAAAPRHGGTSGSGLVWQNIHTYVMVWQYIHTYLSCHYYGWSVCSMLMTGTNSA